MLIHLKQLQMARQHLVLALQLDPSQATARKLLADLYTAPSPQAVQTVGYNAPAPAVEVKPEVVAATQTRPIPVPPLPVIMIGAKN